MFGVTRDSLEELLHDYQDYLYKRYISPPELVDQKYRWEEDKKRLEYRQNNYF
jgi:hypothetical protein